jgi:hypothetical protein
MEGIFGYFLNKDEVAILHQLAEKNNVIYEKMAILYISIGCLACLQFVVESENYFDDDIDLCCFLNVHPVYRREYFSEGIVNGLMRKRSLFTRSI